PVHLPLLLTGFLVERDEERFFFVVALDDELVAGEDRRAAGTEPELHRVRAEVFLPHFLAVEVVAEQPGHAEVRVDPLTVAHRRFGGVGVAAVGGDGRPGFLRHLLPHRLARGAVEADDLELVLLLWRRAAPEAPRATLGAAEAAPTGAAEAGLRLGLA